MNTAKRTTKRLAALARDEQGHPVPYFVAWRDWPNGKPDYRVVDQIKLTRCYYLEICFICGQPLGAYLAFVVGPMCTVSRISAEPPSHIGCAEFAATTCPFMVNPKKTYRDNNLPEGVEFGDGQLTHNPGVTAIWVTKTFKPVMRQGRLLARMDDAHKVFWYKEGREATRAEVEASFMYGAEKFYELAGEEFSTSEFERALERSKVHWPKGVAA